MNAIESIEIAIRGLSEPEKWSLLQRSDAERATAWDNQISADAAAGKLDAPIAEARSCIQSGQVRPLDEIFRNP